MLFLSRQKVLSFTQDGHVGPCQGTLERREGWSGLREGWRPGGHQGSLGAQCEEQPRQPTLGPGVLTCNVMVVPLLLTRILVLYI